MKWGLAAGGLALLTAVSCRNGPTTTPHPLPPPTSLGSGAPQPSVAPSATNPPQPGRTPASTVLAEPAPVSLSAEVRPVSSRSAALLVHADALAGHSYVRRIDDRQRISKVRTLPDRHPVALLEGTHPLLLTSRGEELCFERMDEAEDPTCHRMRAHFALMMGTTPVLLEERLDKTEESDAPKPKPRSRRAKKKRREAKPIRVRLFLHRFDATGKRVGDPIDTELTTGMPWPGMGFIDAGARGKRLRVIYYAHHKPRIEGRRAIKQAKLMSALIGADGKLITTTRREIYRGDRAYGYIEKHHDARLYGSRVLVGRFIDKEAKPLVNRWEVRRLGPVRTVSAPNAVLGVDPWRLQDASVVKADELAALTAIYDAAPRLSMGQPATDAGRVAWVGDRGYFLANATGKLSSAQRSDGAVRTESDPFVAQRSRLHWATLTPEGRGLAQTDRGLVEIRQDGSTQLLRQASHDPIGPPVRIGNDWWAVIARGGSGSGGAVMRLSSSAVEAKALAGLAHAGSHALIGGTERGWFVATSHGRLRSFELAATGEVKPLADVATKLGHGVRGVQRAGGGALLVSSEPARAVAMDAQGRVVMETPLSLPSQGQIVMAAHGDGAVVIDRAGEHVVWLDANARVTGTASWPAGSPVACVDGTPSRTTIPSVTPGKLESIGTLAGAHCWSVPFPVRVDGHHRWLGTAVDGMHSKAVLESLAATTTPSPPAMASAPKVRKQRSGSASPCPADMVSVKGRFCIDRFETQLVDADGSQVSPDYPTTPGILKHIFRAYAAGRWRKGDLRAHAMPLPPLLRDAAATPAITSRSHYGVRPSGFLTWHAAKKACSATGKRLCTENEWVTACRGEQDRKFPYGTDYAHGKCNVWRFAHPAAALHGSASIGHLDPRLNRVLEGAAPLLRETGTTPTCASRWGDDAIYDMVGNLDEWVDHKSGAFMGGFYSRTTKKGCEAKISAHPKRYLDYSLGTRCCRAPN